MSVESQDLKWMRQQSSKEGFIEAEEEREESLYKNYKERGEEWVYCAKELAKAKLALKLAQAQEKKCSERLKQLSEFLPSRGGGLIYDFIIRKGSVEYDRIPELKDINLEIYRKDSTEVWSLSMDLEV